MSTIEFWSMHRVIEVTGLSRTNVYREIRAGRFPKNRPYRDHPRRRFWLSSEVEAWQQTQLGKDAALLSPAPTDEFDALLHDR